MRSSSPLVVVSGNFGTPWELVRLAVPGRFAMRAEISSSRWGCWKVQIDFV